MLKVLILFEHMDSMRENNHLVVSNALLAQHAKVYAGRLSSLRTSRETLTCSVSEVSRQIMQGDDLSTHSTFMDVTNFDAVWLMNQPHVLAEKEVYQLLWRLSKRTKFVNSIEAITFLNNKNNLPALIPADHVVEGYCSSSFDFLWNIVKQSDERWVVKPGNDGCGADVYMISRAENNCRALLQSMTGNAISKYEIYGRATTGNAEKYCLLQKFVPHAADNEKRVIIAGGKVIGAYGKILSSEDHRSNKAQGNRQYLCELSEDETRLCDTIALNCLDNGILFAGIDLAYPFVFELNIVNPGGLITLSRLSGVDFAQIAVGNILSCIAQDQQNAAA